MILFGSRDELATATSRKLICDCNKFVTAVLCQHLMIVGLNLLCAKSFIRNSC
jgi:hypothetical protein